jgi:hypothetical protein
MSEDEPTPTYPTPKNAVRAAAFKVVRHSAFENFILASIAVNSVLMAIEDPVKLCGDDGIDCRGNLYFSNFSSADSALVGRILLWIFTVEMLLKNVAWAPWGYLFGQDCSWNRLDFLVVLLGWIEEYPDYFGGAMPFNLSFLRIFRVLRPLRAMGKIGGLKVLIDTMTKCFDPLTDVMMLTVFIFFVFSVLGMELFQGQASLRCIAQANGDKWPEETVRRMATPPCCTRAPGC